jgi:hypothetical protein
MIKNFTSQDTRPRGGSMCPVVSWNMGKKKLNIVYRWVKWVLDMLGELLFPDSLCYVGNCGYVCASLARVVSSIHTSSRNCLAKHSSIT